MNDLKRIESFIKEHHVMSLATSVRDELSVCSLFYVYDKEKKSFIVASNKDTIHIQHIKVDENIAGNILLETKELAKIKGLQFRGKFLELKDSNLEQEYFDNFPYAQTLKPRLWQIKINYFKLTDNSLGFAKKIILSDF